MDLSILIPFYKGNDFINDTISSIYKNFADLTYEIIIVNDSPEVCVDIWNIEKNTFIYENESNLGIAESRNKAFQKSKGQYIMFLDQDDMLVEDFFFTKEILKLNKELFILNINLFAKSHKRIFYRNRPFYFHTLTEKHILKHGPIFKTVSQMIFKRELFKEFIKSKSQGADDFFFYCDLIKMTNKNSRMFIYTPQIDYRVHNDNYSFKADFYGSLNEIFEIYNKRNNYVYTGLNNYYLKKSIIWRIIHKIEIIYLCKNNQ